MLEAIHGADISKEQERTRDHGALSESSSLNLGSMRLADVQAANKGSASLPAAFGNLDIDHGKDIKMASASSDQPQPGHVRIPINKGGIYTPGPGTDCGPITLYPGKNGGLVADVTPGPQGCTVARPAGGKHH